MAPPSSITLRRLARRSVGWLAAVLVVGVVFRLTGCMERLFYQPDAGPTPVPREFPRGELIAFASADGTALSGWFLPAEGGAGGAPAPTILHAHGNAGNVASHVAFSEFLPAAGFNVFLFDYRGYGQSAGAPRRRADLVADAHAALDVLLARRDVDPDRIGLFGHSLGGSVGLNVMAGRPEIRCAVIMSAFASWREVAAGALGGRRPGWIARSVAAALIRDDLRPDESAARIDRPLLLLYGDADGIVPVEHGRRLLEAAPRAELRVFKGGDHNTLRWTHPEADAAMAEFFRRHLE